ncbi:MAG TPA: GDP-L-fucose synthase [Candidatus Acidoferrales bacterium]
MSPHSGADQNQINHTSRIYVAGDRGLVGSAICRRLQSNGCTQLITRSRTELDLLNQSAVERFFATEKPEYVFLAAARVGGIFANATRPAEFLRENLLIQTNVIDSAYRHGAKKLLFLGSSCIYPKFAPQPIQEESLLTSALEPTNEAYALAKIAGLKMAQAYRQQYGFNAISLMPTNLYGPNDNFDPESSHVVPALIRRFHEATQKNAPEVTIWGTGTVRREMMHVDDLAEACVFLMQHYDQPGIVNVGIGEDVTIRKLAEMIAEIAGFRGRIVQDTSKPDGTPRKLLDVSRLNALGWRARIPLREGLEQTYRWFVTNIATAVGQRQDAATAAP